MAAAAAEAISRRLGAASPAPGPRGPRRPRTVPLLPNPLSELCPRRYPLPRRPRPPEPDRRRLIVLNKADLADPSETEKWVAYMKQRSCSSVAVNSHGKESIEEVVRTVLMFVASVACL